MTLLPYEKYNLYTRLSPEEARQRVADNTEQGGTKKPLGGKMEGSYSYKRSISRSPSSIRLIAPRQEVQP